VADQDKIGTPWDDGELDAIIADYFAMLDDELSRRRYVKAAHSAALMDWIGRTHRSARRMRPNRASCWTNPVELGMVRS